jgi:pyocin large subunit-like protein
VQLLRRLCSILVFLAIAALTVLAGCDARGRPRDRDRAPEPPAAEAPAADREGAPRFAPGQLEQHFRKHGGEMGFATKEDYLRAAQALVRGGPGVETWRRGGDTLFFKEQTNEFAVLSDRNVIRTYFRPDDGRRYWERQKQR